VSRISLGRIGEVESCAEGGEWAKYAFAQIHQDEDRQRWGSLALESIMALDVSAALRDWTKITGLGAVLIDDLALCYHAKPRTQGIFFLFKAPADMPDTVAGFTRIRVDGFEHKKIHVELKVVVPASADFPQNVVDRVFDTAVEGDGVRIADRLGPGRSEVVQCPFAGKADIVALIKTGKVDLTDSLLYPEQLRAFDELIEIAKTESD
jgi:hypothetical protein